MSTICKVEFTTMSENISHPGIVERIENNVVYVHITQYSACAGCHAKSACTAADKKDKIIEVEDSSGNYQIGDAVVLTGQSSMGMEAVVLAFVCPVIVVLIAVIIGSAMGWKETMAGLLGLCMLIPYYGILYVLREKLKRHFVFRLKKLKE